tara:strand:+ start:420 stop:569 length:150 start_codon:yes stop_codon:yes gene_type:complete
LKPACRQAGIKETETGLISYFKISLVLHKKRAPKHYTLALKIRGLAFGC